MSLQKQNITIPISNGLDTKTDSKQVMAGKALQLENIRFYKSGKLQKRFGLVIQTNTTNSGTLSSNTVRAIVADNDYMAAVTTGGIFGYSSSDSQWFNQSRFTVSPKVRSEYVAKNYFDQKSVDSDVTSDGTYMAYIARQEITGLTPGYLVVLEDLATGLKKTASVNIGTGMGLQRVLTVKSAGVLYVHVFYYDGTNLLLDIYDKNLAIISSATVMTTLTNVSQFDVCKDATSIYVVRITGTNITTKVLNLVGAVQSTNSITATNALGAAASYAYGMSIVVDASWLHVSYIGAAGWVLKGLTKAGLAQITELLSASDYRKIGLNTFGSGLCLAVGRFPTATIIETDSYSVTYTSSTYTETLLGVNYRMTVASQPFEISSKVFCIYKSSDTNNKNYYVVNLTDNYVAGKISVGLALDSTLITTELVSMVPKVTVLSGVVYIGIERLTRIDTDEEFVEFFSTSGISKIKLDFNLAAGDNCRQKVGSSIYLNSGLTLEIDKRRPHENGFMIDPVISSVAQVLGVGNPNIASQTFAYCAIYEYVDSSGQISRSAPSLSVSITTAANAQSITVSFKELVSSLKQLPTGTGREVAPVVVVYRTANNGSVFYRLEESLITAITGTTGTISDTTEENTLINNEILYTSGDVLANDPAPLSSFSTSGGNRIFLGGLEETDEIAYSKKQLFGESVAFSDFFRIRVASGTSADKSKISALGYLDGKLVIFRQNSIYFIQGDGPNETGLGGNFTDPEPISSDVGCTDPRSVVNAPNGLMFKSRKGVYLLDRSLQTSYIGAGVEDFNAESIVAALVSDKYNESRFYTNAGNCLVYNFQFDAWSVFINQTVTDADIWAFNPVSILSNRVYKETEAVYLDNSVAYSMKLKTPWLKLSGLQDFGRIWSLEILGEFKSAHTLRVIVYTDYGTTAVQTRDITPLITDKQYQYRVHLKVQKCESMQFVIQDITPVGESMDLSALTVEVGTKTGSFKLPATRKY